MKTEIKQIVAISVLLTATKCTEFVFGRGSTKDPAGELLRRSPDPLVGWGGGHSLHIPLPSAPTASLFSRLRPYGLPELRRSSWRLRRLVSSVPPLLCSQLITLLTDTVKRRDCYFKLYSLWHWEPMKHVAKSRRDVFVSANTNDQTGSSVQNHLKSTFG